MHVCAKKYLHVGKEIDTVFFHQKDIVLAEKNHSNLPVISLSVAFTPTPWKRPAGKSVRYDDQVRDKSAFAILVIDELNKNYPDRKWDLFNGPNFDANCAVSVDIIFQFKDSRVGRKGLQYPKPDVDNLSKFVLDALQSTFLEGIIWGDDKQVVKLSAIKVYNDKDLITIEIKEMEINHD